jgi:hypothetical protein
MRPCGLRIEIVVDAPIDPISNANAAIGRIANRAKEKEKENSEKDQHYIDED